MADEQQQDDLDINTDDEMSSVGGAKKGSFLNPFIIRILSIVALIITMFIIAILVLIVGSNIMQPRSGGTVTGPETDVIQPRDAEHFEYVNLEDPFRQQLRDGKMIQLDISLGYKKGNKKIQQELTQIVPEIRDIVILYLSRRDSVFFAKPNALDVLKEDLLKQINRIVNSGKVERIFIEEYTLM